MLEFRVITRRPVYGKSRLNHAQKFHGQGHHGGHLVKAVQVQACMWTATLTVNGSEPLASSEHRSNVRDNK